MVKLAIASVSYFVYSDFELKREGNTYTAQTLTLLREAYPQHEFYFIIGADSLYGDRTVVSSGTGDKQQFYWQQQDHDKKNNQF